ncbi:hypothetical protein FOXB_00002, partial [Fusarium oxysporum f. sp. conglutinans Fo5176]
RVITYTFKLQVDS